MIAQVVPQFFTTDLARTLSFYEDMLGFRTQFLYGEPAFYAGALRDGQSIFFRHVEGLLSFAAFKYEQEYLDAYIIVQDIDPLHDEYRAKNVTFTRDLASQPWAYREFVIRDCDDRLLCFGQAQN